MNLDAHTKSSIIDNPKTSEDLTDQWKVEEKTQTVK